MPYANLEITVDEVKTRLEYHPETGKFFWRYSPAKNVFAGSEAGCVKAVRVDKNGVPRSYRYIKLDRDIPAARLAWAIYYGAWPAEKILFVDKNPLNLRIDNLKAANSLLKSYDQNNAEERKSYLKDHREAFPDVWKNSYLKKRYDISLAEYTVMAVAQGNICAICKKPETEMRNGNVKALSVDHNHTTGENRELLCTACNKMIGLACEDVSILQNAINYLNKHTANDENVVKLNPKVHSGGQ